MVARVTPRPYSIDLVTRGYEADPTRRVPLPMMLQYLEHLRWRSIVDPTSGLAPFVDLGHFFVVRNQEMCVQRAVGQDTALRAYMWPRGIGRSRIELGHELRRVEDGALVARAHVVGLWLDPNRRLSRIPDALRTFSAAIEAPEEAPAASSSTAATDRHESSYIRPPDLVFPERGLDIVPPADPPADGAFEYRTHVRPSDLDIFAHVNAATYLRFCDDARVASDGILGLGLRRPLMRCSIHHEKETVEGEPMRIQLWRPQPDEDLLAFWITAGEDDSLRCSATVELAPVGPAAGGTP